MYRVLVTGYRLWNDYELIYHTLDTYCFRAINTMDEEPVIVQGGSGNVDLEARHYAKIMGYDYETHPADWERYGKAAGPRRNQHMVDLGADICLAFTHKDSRGTIDCMERARKAGIPVVEIPWEEYHED